MNIQIEFWIKILIAINGSVACINGLFLSMHTIRIFENNLITQISNVFYYSFESNELKNINEFNE